MSAAQQPTTTVATPRGWTDVYEEMGGDYEWGPEGVAAGLAARLGLARPTPCFAQTLSSGGPVRLFQAGDAFYLWNPIQGHVWRATKPTTLAEIAGAISSGGLAAVACEEVDK
ncbi:hypothetical protein CDD83_8563 [Cordyceps sp. RAO-2017]|nr:hypothetical protein CDD83_8563 [Cordyceps sp. RAO-2017]